MIDSRLEPQSGHFSRLSRPVIGKAAPLVQTRVCKSSSAFQLLVGFLGRGKQTIF
jgi:hypothetical protein